MKNQIITIILVAACSLMSAQDVTLCGNITNPKTKTISFYKENSNETVASAKLDSLGNFHVNIPELTEGYFTYSHGDEFQTIYLKPGDSIYITLDTKFFDETALYSGKGSIESTILGKWYMINELMGCNSPYSDENIHKKNPAEIFERMEKLKDVKIALLNDYKENPDISKEFIKTETNKVIFSTIAFLQMLETVYKRNNPEYFDLITGRMRDTYINSNIIFDTSLFAGYQYQSIIRTYLYGLTSKEQQRDSIYYADQSYGFYAAYLKVVQDHENFVPEFKDYCLYQEVMLNLSWYYSLDKIPEFYADFQKHCQTGYLKTRIENKVKTFDSWLKYFSIEDSSMLTNGEFISFSLSYVYNEASKKEGFNDLSFNEKIKLELDVVDEIMSSHVYKDLFYYRLIDNYIRWSPSEQDKEIINRFQRNCLSEKYKDLVSEKLNTLKSLQKGKKAPVFTAVDMNGNEHSLSEFIGKYVYIDVWATWCGPCLGEIPHLKKLHEDYMDDNIEFISVSLDTDADKWAAMVKDKELKDIQLISTDAWKSTICKDYHIYGIPTFIFIDDKGNMITTSAPRPSGNIRELFDKYLK